MNLEAAPSADEGKTPVASNRFTYELKSKQIRRYRVYSMMSVYRGISSNIQDYLEYQGLEENKFNLWSYFPYLWIFLLGGYIVYRWFSNLQTPWDNYLIVLFYLLHVFNFFWGSMFKVPNVIFTGTGIVEVTETSTEVIKSLKETGKPLRVLLELTESTSTVLLKMQIVNKEGIFPAKYPLLCGVEQRIPYRRYFSKQGFFVSDLFKKDTDALLERLLKRYLR